MKSFFIVLSSIILVSCSTNPKGEYSRTKIERPYSLPHDVASAEIGVRSVSVETSEIENDVEDESETYSSTLMEFEDGINSSVSWVYPIGLRAKFYSDEKHTFGASGVTFFIYTQYQVDYWYRVNQKVSLRPSFTNEQIDFLFYNEKKQLTGLEMLYQVNNHLALSLYGGAGTYESNSDLFDKIIEDITGEEQEDTEVSGDIKRLSLGAVYSFSELWDGKLKYIRDMIEVDEFKVDSNILDLSFVYYY